MRYDRDNLLKLFRLHKDLDEKLLNRGSKPFISDWNGTHPLVDEYMDAPSNSPKYNDEEYLYIDQDKLLSEKILMFHKKYDTNINLHTDNVIATEGASSLITTINLWLRECNTKEIFYVPPIYYTFSYFLGLFNIRARPVAGNVAFGNSPYALNLPEKRTILLLSDPIWFAGQHQQDSIISTILEWQKRTQSIVIVDGAFQYMRWSGVQQEKTSSLDPLLTIRLICPTKSLAIHGIRFAYAITPKNIRAKLNQIYENSFGSASVANLSHAHRTMEILNSSISNQKLLVIIKSRFGSLNKACVFNDVIKPDCGYFVFGKVCCKSDGSWIGMGPELFQLKGYLDYVRVNLLNDSAIHALLNRDTH